MNIQNLINAVRNVQYIYRYDTRPRHVISQNGFVPQTGVNVNYFINNVFPYFEAENAIWPGMEFPAAGNPLSRYTLPKFYVCFSPDSNIYQCPNYRVAVNFQNIYILATKNNMIIFTDGLKTYLAIGTFNLCEINCLDMINTNIETFVNGAWTRI